MGDWANPYQDQNRVTISTSSPESLGLELGAMLLSPASAASTINRAYFVPFVVRQPFTVVNMFISNGATATGQFDMGVYDTQKNRIVSIGANTTQVGVSTTQVVAVPSTTLDPGPYYMAWKPNLAALTALRYSVVAASVASGLGVLYQVVAGVLPDPAVWVAATTQTIPHFGLSARTTV